MPETPRDKLPRRITDPALVAEAVILMATEKAACRGCQEAETYKRTTGHEQMHPAHFHAYVHGGMLIQSPCESHNRVFDPAIHAFVGHGHCSCDSCF